MPDTLWGAYTLQVANRLGAGTPSASVQVLTSAELVSGTTPKEVTTAVADFCGVVPQWGSAYVPSPSTVIDAYQVVLTQIHETATNGTSIEAQYTKEQARLAAMMGQASNYKTSKIQAWAKAAATYREAGLKVPTFASWFADNGQQVYDSKLAAQKAQATKVKTLLQAAGIASPVVQALAALNDELSALSDDVAAPVTVNPDASTLAGWVTTPVDPGGMTFDQSSTQYDYASSTWASQSGFSLMGFVSVGDRTKSGQHKNLLDDVSTYSIDLEFAAQGAFTVAQDNWFDGALLKDYAAGPWIAGSSFATKAAHPYGDADAVLPLVVTRFYAVLNPSVSITLHTSDYSSTYATLSDNMKNGVNVGPFAFGGSNADNSSTLCQAAAVTTNQTLTLRDTSNVPQIIAVSCQVMP